MKRSLLTILCSALILAACSTPAVPSTPGLSAADVQSAVQATLTAWPTMTAAPPTGILFDDFTYSGSDDPDLTANGWIPRDTEGGPGIPGAQWSSENISFIDDPDLSGNTLMQLTSVTDGTPANTVQSELFHQRKFYEGTYASRVRFTDDPVSGPDGDNIVQTFFTITPLNYDLDPDYGEIDFEYLPNGGWGEAHNVFFMTTWETYQAEPWQAVNDSDDFPLSFADWHILIAQVSGARVRYFVDGVQLVEHGDVYYPETPMSINYNLWFIDGGLIDGNDLRQYIEQADWLYYAANEVLSPDQVDERVAAYRNQQITHVDTVPEWTAPPVVIPPMPTPANLGPRPFEASIPNVSGITVDGTLSDWPADAPTFVIDQESQLAYVAGDSKWDGPADLSANVWLGWSEDGLYLAAHVTDDQIVQAQADTLIWQGDYLEMQIDTDLEGDFNDVKMSDDDFQLGFSPGDFGKVPAFTMVWKGHVEDAQLPLIQQAQTETDDGYIIEVFIPAELFPAMKFEADATFGLNINPSDSDGAVQEVMMSTSPIRQLDNPSTLGKITLLGK